MYGRSGDVVQLPDGPSYLTFTSRRAANCRAVSRPGDDCATAREYSRERRRIIEFKFSPTRKPKNSVTSKTRHIAIASIAVTSLAKTDPRSHSGTRVSHEAVTDAAHGANERRLLGIVAELLTQAADQHVDRSIERFPVDAVCALDDPLATQDAPAIADEISEQFELRGGQRQWTFAQPRGTCGEVQLDGASAQDLLLRVAREANAAQHRLHPGHQLTRLE